MLAPFCGLLFAPGVVAPGAVTSPPYDVIDDEMRQRLQRTSPHNVVRLLLPEGGDERYQTAARLLAEWQQDGVLVRDGAPRFYLYEMDYPHGTGVRTARGVLGGLALLPLGDRVLPHEETMDKFRRDRAALLAATGANLDPIIVLSPAVGLAALLRPPGPPRLDFAAGGLRHRLYDVADPGATAAIAAAVDSAPVAIADGHHRYTTALAHARRRHEEDGAGEWDRVLAFVAPAAGGGLRIDPVHRVFDPAAFHVDAVTDVFELSEALPRRPERPGDLVVVTGRGAGPGPWLLHPREEALAALPEPWRTAGPAVARELLYPRLGLAEADAHYLHRAGDAVAYTELHRGSLAVLTAPIDEATVAGASRQGLCFPQKTTYYFPKPRAGLVLRPLDGQPK